MKLVIPIFFILFLSGCGPESSDKNSINVKIPEPTLFSKGESYLFSDFDGRKKASLSLVDKLKFKDANKKIDIQVNTLCLLNSTKIASQFKSSLKKEYSILELMPFEIISALKNKPIVFCDFYFKAFNDKEMFHRFKLTNIKIRDYSKKINIDLYAENINLVKESKIRNHHFELFSKDTEKIYLDCEGFYAKYNKYLSAVNSFDGFILKKITFYNPAQLFIKKHKQVCRILNFNQYSTVGISSYFNLHLNFISPKIKIDWRPLEKPYKTRESWKPLRVANVSITNKSNNIQYYKINKAYSSLNQYLFFGLGNYRYAKVSKLANVSLTSGRVVLGSKEFNIVELRPTESLSWSFSTNIKYSCKGDIKNFSSFFLSFDKLKFIKAVDFNPKDTLADFAIPGDYQWTSTPTQGMFKNLEGVNPIKGTRLSSLKELLSASTRIHDCQSR